MERLPLPLLHQGKVRDTYALPGFGDLMLMVATDRASTHNVTHVSEIPRKGEYLTAQTVFFAFDVLRDIPNHIAVYGSRIYCYLPGLSGRYFAGEPARPEDGFPADLHRRALIVKKLTMIPVEFVWRRRLTGSLYAAYSKRQDPHELRLMSGLKKMSLLPGGKCFTPTDKSKTDDPLLRSGVEERYPQATWLSREAFIATSAYMRTCGLEQIDAKYEIGLDGGGGCVLADEFATGDCSRMTFSAVVKEGEEPPWLDKQVLRDEAERVWGSAMGEPLTFSAETIARAEERYAQAFRILTGMPLSRFQETVMD